MTPAEEYSSRLAAREANARHLEMMQERVSTVRLLLAAVVIVLAWLSWHQHRFPPHWILVPVAAFAGAVAYHVFLRRRHMDAARGAAFYRRGMARIKDRWVGTGNQGERFNDIHHLYAADLDVFGEGGLFELLCDARTRMGEETLAGWLLAPAAPSEIRERHAAIADLRGRVELREHIAKRGEEGKTAVRPQTLVSWSESPNVLSQPWVRWVAALLPLLFVGSLMVGLLTDFWLPCTVILALEVAVLYGLGRRTAQVLTPAESAIDSDGLKTFSQLLSRIEGERFESLPMQAIASTLCPRGARASGSMGRLSTIVALAEHRRNMVVRWLLAAPLLYPIQVALAAERWRQAYGASVRSWVEAVGRFEALSSLAQYSFEHPDDPLPELAEGPPCLRADGIGHPLIPSGKCVRSNVSLMNPVRILLVSGSNMSGKSTLLRAVGLNTVLAMAGAPVRARALRITPLEVGASIRVNDSLREGSSRFYAEITRLRQINEIAERGLPLLFLLDEMLQGTNSRDRRIGAEGVLKALMERSAIGLVTTHDLALTELQGLAEDVVRNVHFQDYLEDGRMRFDFTLRDGVVTRSNGVELMRAIGLRV